TAYEIGLGIPAEPLFRSVQPDIEAERKKRDEIEAKTSATVTFPSLNLFLSLILHLGNLFLIVQLHFSKLFLILKSGVNHTSRGKIGRASCREIVMTESSS